MRFFFKIFNTFSYKLFIGSFKMVLQIARFQTLRGKYSTEKNTLMFFNPILSNASKSPLYKILLNITVSLLRS
jgi:hypothetical protein